MDAARLAALLAHVQVLENHPRGGGVLAGPPSVLAALCADLGFRNRCERGRVFITAAKMRALGLADAPGADPTWRKGKR